MRLKLISLIVIALTGCQTTLVRQQDSTEPNLPQVSRETSSTEDSNNSVAVDQNEIVVPTSLPQTTQIPPAKAVTYQNVWVRLANQMTMDVPLNDPRVQSQLNWFRHHPAYLERVSKRATPYIYWVMTQLKQREMPLELALLPIVESAYDPFAYSHGQASGMWQIIPGTAKHLGLRRNWWYDGRRDVAASTDAALDYLEWLNKLFDGNWLHAIAAYNSGQGRVINAIRDNRKQGRPVDFWHLNLPRETEAYVPKLLALSEVVKHPQKYNIQLPKIDNEPYLQQVNVGSQIDLALAAKLADIDLKTLYQLNPGFNRWATDPNGPHRLLLPVDKADAFKQSLANLPHSERVQWQRHKVVDGDSLGKIAKNYHTTTRMLRNINHLSNNMIRIGQHLIVPVSARQPSQYILSKAQRIARLQSSPVRQPNQIKVTYTIKNGDTLWDIGQKYHVDYQKLAKWNGLSPKDQLHKGRKLVIWQQLTAKSGGITRSIVYQVHAGDSLARIANKFNVKISDLIKWNDLNRHSYLQPGQKLKVYVDVTRLNV
ncbi:LysM peptidoglycan-binding domain-containing protein [Celerinatantimonas sp. YJH-8]|uniref:lytic transglycosylase n=1 Tax=Celerinatantimonas sp. YJH-8 TaxID=3228714 RepID=UPI0038CBF589